MRSLIGIIVCSAFLAACATERSALSQENASKKQVMEALTEVCGEHAAEDHFREWMAEYKMKPEDGDDEEVYSEILEQIKRGNPSPAAMKQEIVDTRERLLHKTEHQALVSASREVMRTRHSYKRDRRWRDYGSGGSDPEVSLIVPNDPKLPDAVRVLQGESLICEDERLEITFRPGFHSMGFFAYAAGVTNTPAKAGNRSFEKIIDGLWFYEDPPWFFHHEHAH